MPEDLTRLGNEAIDALVEDLLSQKKTLEEALPQPFGAAEAPLSLRLVRFNQAMQTGPPAFAALIKVFGRRQTVQEFNELYPQWKQLIAGLSSPGSVNGGQESADTTGDQGDEGSVGGGG